MEKGKRKRKNWKTGKYKVRKVERKKRAKKVEGRINIVEENWKKEKH